MVQRPRLVSSYQKRWVKPVSSDDTRDENKKESQDDSDGANDAEEEEASLASEEPQTEKKSDSQKNKSADLMREYLDIKPLYG